MRIILTKRVIAQSQPQQKPYELRDITTKGLLVRVQPSGHKAYIVTWQHGKRRTLGSVDHLTLEQARSYAAQAVSEAVQQRLPALATIKQKASTLRTFLDEHYGPWAVTELRRGGVYVERIKQRFPALLDRSMTDIDVATLNRWWANRVAPGGDNRGVVRATAHRDFAALRAALSKAVEWKLLDRNALLGMRQKSAQARKIVRFLSPDEEASLRSALAIRDLEGVHGRANANAMRRRYSQPVLPDLPLDGYCDHLTPVVLLAVNTGMRRGELLSLEWSDVNLVARIITVQAKNAKSGKQRHIPMNAEAYSVLSKWRAQTAGAGQVFDPQDIKKGWGSLLAAAKIEQFRFHDLRHHFASKLVMAGVDLNTVRELLGHSDITMTLRYAHLGPEHLKAAVERLSA